MKLLYESLGDFLDSVRPVMDGMLIRLDELGLPYHNGSHVRFRSEAVSEMVAKLPLHERLDTEKKLLLGECALLLDLGRLRPEDGRSYEERSMDVARTLYGDRMTVSRYRFMERQLLAYSFRWNDYGDEGEGGRTSGGRIPERAGTTASTATQKMLGLADVFHFSRGWEPFLDASLKLVEEYPKDSLFRVDGFVRSRKEFLKSFVGLPLKRMAGHLEPSYHRNLLRQYDMILRELDFLDSGPDHPSGRSLQARLDDIRERVSAVPA